MLNRRDSKEKLRKKLKDKGLRLNTMLNRRDSKEKLRKKLKD